MNKKLFEIASDIVQAQVSSGQMSPEQIQSTLLQTFNTLQKMKKAEEDGLSLDAPGLMDGEDSEEQASEKLNPHDSIQNDKVVCLECRAEFRQLTARHLASHGLSPKEYKKKYGFTLRTPLSAKSLTKARSKAAKKRGLPENLVKYREEQRRKKMEELEGPLDDMQVDILEPVAMTADVVEKDETEAKIPAKRGRKKKST